MKKYTINNAYHGLRIALLVICILTNAESSKAQLIKSVSFPEALWAISHPFKLNKAWKATNRTIFLTDSLSKLDTLCTLGDNTADAFMHCMWLTLLTKEIDSSAAMKLAMAHEKGNVREWRKGSHRHDSTSRKMDILNNYIGVECGRFCVGMTEQETTKYVLKTLRNGKLNIIARDEDNDFIDVNGTKIKWPPEVLIWYSGRVLCPSNS